MKVIANTKLSDWSEEWIKTVLDNDQGEELFFDFKENINSKDPKHNYNIRKAVASFANTFGGFLVFGIRDKAATTGWDRLCGVNDVINFSKELTDKISGGKIIPHIFFENPKVIEITHGINLFNVVVVKFENSELKPHAIISDGSGLLEFWMRGNSSAIPATYPHLMRMLEESSDVRNWLAALFLDTQYVDSFAEKMVLKESERENYIPLVQVRALVNSDQSSQIISKIPTDIALIERIWKLREHIDYINCHREMMLQRYSLPQSNTQSKNKADNDAIAETVPKIKEITASIRKHLAEKYSSIREWINVIQRTDS